jgi:hypothetical protein
MLLFLLTPIDNPAFLLLRLGFFFWSSEFQQ